MNTVEEQAAAVRRVLSKEQKFTGPDLQILRNNTAAVSHMSGKSDYFVFRMEVELIDAIRALDEASAKLITKTNALTFAILGLTVVGVVLTGVQVWITLRSSH